MGGHFAVTIIKGYDNMQTGSHVENGEDHL
jgi:hypothetical protein